MTLARIVLMEDERILALHLKQQLVKLGYDVVAVTSSGATALEKISLLRPDLVLMDIHVEGDIDGIETAARIPCELEIPVIYLTAYSEEATLARARATKPYGYIIKPFSERELHATIQMALERRRANIERGLYERKLEDSNASLERLARHLESARAKADRASRAKTRFLAGMSHELRTPLNGLLGYIQLLRFEGGLNVIQSERIEAMMEAGNHLLEMITCVLDLSEIEAEHVILRPVQVDALAIARACLDLVRPMAEGKGLGLSLWHAPGMPLELIADPARLRQILLNLLGNATKFTSRGRVELHLRASAGKSVLRIEVADTGPGVPPEDRPRLFQDFERLDTEASRLTEGAGLGLAVSARLAALMGGCIGHDDNPGGGSVFWLELPLNHAVLATAAAPVEDEGISPTVGGCQLLVVDDIAMNREIASSFLSRAGHSVTSVDGGEAAIKAVSSTDFDLVLMDVRMPGIDGLEATRRIRALEGKRAQVPIMALTAQAFTEQVEECRKAGMDSHLVKPFDPDTLVGAVTQAITEARKRVRDLPVAPGSTQLVAPGIPVIGSDISVVDLTAFERTASFLSAEAVASYLSGIVTLGNKLLEELRQPDALVETADKLAETAHTLAGSAGMFGFGRVAALGRRFEQALASGSAETPALADGLCAALEDTSQAIRDHFPTAVECGAVHAQGSP